MSYTIERLREWELDNDPELIEFIRDGAKQVAELYGHKFDWTKFKIRIYAFDHRITICRKDGRPVGAMLSRLYGSIFDDGVKILYQDLLYAKPGTRAAKLLMDDFIDFGRSNANHIISAIGEHTNIKRRSLEKLGFKKLEELYRLET